jgi:hypothetical protein
MDMGRTVADVAPLAEELVRRQNSDGGWGYTNQSSWTEPTSLALLALNGTGAFRPECARGEAWLRTHQRHDGGWPPQPGIALSTWVTAAVLLVPEMQNFSGHRNAINWVMNKSGRESSITERFRRLLLGTQAEVGEGTTGWPWFPDTAAWVTPTVFSLLALRKFVREQSTIAARISDGQRFLLARACADGGWNHGGAKALGYAAASYPDTTGQALLALQGIADPRVERAIKMAGQQSVAVRSSEAASWLQLGLLAHGQNPLEPAMPAACRTTNAFALRMLATAARSRNAFL